MSAKLKVEWGERVAALEVAPGQTVTVGSGERASFQIADASVADRQLALTYEGGGLQVVDLGGPARVLLGGRAIPLRDPTPLSVGDRIQLGPCLLVVEVAGAALGFPQQLEHDYELGRQLGEGGVGTVFAARRRKDGVKVAIKLLRDHYPPGSPTSQRFLREGRAAMQVKSPYVVEVLDVQVEDGRAWVIMERISGPTAHELLAKGPLALPLVLKIGADVAQALETAAAAGVVHRDVKPSNVLLGPDRKAKLVDFGYAKCLDDSLRSLTVTGQGLGTPGYLAPEQLTEARHADPLADVYGLGATLYHLLTGRPPHLVRTVEELAQVLTTPPQPVGELRGDCSPELAALVAAMLATDPAQRPPAWRVRQSLERLASRSD